MHLINCEINLDLNWSKNWVIVADNANQDTTFSMTDTKLYAPVVTLLTQDNVKLFNQSRSCFKRTINWNKYQSKKSVERPNQYLDYLTDPSFKGINILFVLSFENEAQRTSYKGYYRPAVEVKNYNFMIDGQNVFDQSVRNNIILFEKLKQVQEMIIQLVVSWTMIIFKNIIR